VGELGLATTHHGTAAGVSGAAVSEVVVVVCRAAREGAASSPRLQLQLLWVTRAQLLQQHVQALLEQQLTGKLCKWFMLA
jgi:hypothetical protein